MTDNADSVSGAPHGRLRISRYDLLLAFVPLAFATAVTVGYVLSIPFEIALFVAAIVGAAVIADGLFLHPPINGTGGS